MKRRALARQDLKMRKYQMWFLAAVLAAISPLLIVAVFRLWWVALTWLAS